MMADVEAPRKVQPTSAQVSETQPTGSRATSASIKAQLEADPLKDPEVRRTLDTIKVSGPELIAMSVRELNRRLVDYPTGIVAKLKKCRRTLKNRGYAKNCRIKRIAAKDQLERMNLKLELEIKELSRKNKMLLEQLEDLHNLLSAQASLKLSAHDRCINYTPEDSSSYPSNAGVLSAIHYDCDQQLGPMQIVHSNCINEPWPCDYEAQIIDRGNLANCYYTDTDNAHQGLQN